MKRLVTIGAVCASLFAAVALGKSGGKAKGNEGRALDVPVSPAARARHQLLAMHHVRWVVGNITAARRGLAKLLEDGRAPARYRAQAALRLAEIAEIAGESRRALQLLARVKPLVGQGHALTLRADDRQKRIRSTGPLIDVRGPAPGTTLVGSAPAVAALFRRAERGLVRYHRVVVAPRLENIDTVLLTKRGALRAAVKAYQAVVERGDAQARAAALYRIATMYHHLAEAIAFDTPPELKRSVAERLMRKLRAKSARYLREALAYYSKATAVKESAARRWRALAQRERATLARVVTRKR
ncbi:MAG: hypothetical protein KC503_11435 [Myxococcales bacterium]|nr:hypothetical protein [Myxococcales bacterium]